MTEGGPNKKCVFVQQASGQPVWVYYEFIKGLLVSGRHVALARGDDS